MIHIVTPRFIGVDMEVQQQKSSVGTAHIIKRDMPEVYKKNKCHEPTALVRLLFVFLVNGINSIPTR